VQSVNDHNEECHWMALVQFLPVQDFSLLHTVQTTLGPTQPPIQWVLGALSPGIKQRGCEANQSHPSSAEVKKGGAIPPLPHMPSWRRT
jgi:hypothetical protein